MSRPAALFSGRPETFYGAEIPLPRRLKPPFG
jgi:hypothetical protein